MPVPTQFGTGSRSVKAVQKKPGRLWLKESVKQMSRWEQKADGVTVGESEGGVCDEVMRTGCGGEPGGE